MAILPFTARDRAEMYAYRQHLTIEKVLGGGVDGIVLGTSNAIAIKALNDPILYRQEKAVYLHLRRKQIRNIGGFQIPTFIGSDDTHSIIEMSVVSPPFVVDFVGAKLSRPAPFDDEIMAHWYAQKKEEFEDDWPKVRMLIFAFERHGVFLTDVHPGNVKCR